MNVFSGVLCYGNAAELRTSTCHLLVISGVVRWMSSDELDCFRCLRMPACELWCNEAMDQFCQSVSIEDKALEVRQHIFVVDLVESS